MKSRNALLASLFAIAIPGCLEHPITTVELCKVQNPEVQIPLEEKGDVDILFVIDNSGSMAQEQSRLARNFEAFAARLDAMGAHYRIGITTTDVGNPRCPQALTTPEAGDLVLRSCLDRVGEGAFQFDDVDASYACTDVCGLSGEHLAVQATVTDRDPERKARPWLENIDGVSNLPEGVSMADAFACFGPQGIDGCGYEQPLEAMYLAVKKALVADEGNYGFLRDDALLSIILVTDEADCSHDPAFSQIFTPSNTTFWEDPSAPAPTSALCWNAGVACQGPGPVYEGCEPGDYAIDGSLGAADGMSVLRPVSRYTELLDQIRRDKQIVDASRDVLVSLIAGVPIGYEDGSAEIVYQDAPADSQQQKDFGVAPGCVAQDGSNSTAVPPVRERAVAEAFSGGERNLYSICQDDYTPALEGIARRLEKAIEPVCGTAVVADADPETPELEPTCKIQQIVGEEVTDVPACVPVGDADWAVPEGSTVCSIALTDAGGATETSRDDMTLVDGVAPCFNAETNVEFKLVRSGPRVRGATYSATCLSDTADGCEG